MSTELARLQRDLAEERHYLRAAALLIAYSGGLFVLGVGLTKLIPVGLVVMTVSATTFLFGVGWAVRYGTRVAKYSREIRAMTRLPVARVLDR